MRRNATVDSVQARSLARAAVWPLSVGLAVALSALGGVVAQACSTPMYRYAMYNWAPAPAFVFYFHGGETPAEDAAVNKLIEAAAMAESAPANIVFQSVDISAGEQEKLPGPVLEAWKSHVAQSASRGPGEKADASAGVKQAGPVYLVFTSWGAKLHAGPLDQATVQAMLKSPVRTKVCELLRDGNAAVMLFLPGTSAEENQQAEKTAREVISLAAAGKIEVELGLPDVPLPQGAPMGETTAEAPAAAPSADEDRMAELSRIKLGLITVGRSDPAEKWLVESLTAVESDLGELAAQPMIFFVFGRGRVMPPYVGKGITTENLVAEVQFLAGACSCFVKDQNPGADLLVSWDWDATADALAAKDPSLSGGLFAYEEFSPDEQGNMVAASEAVQGPAISGQGAPGKSDSVLSAAEGQAGGARLQPSASSLHPLASGPQPPVSSPASPATIAESRPLAADAPPSGSFAIRQMWTFGIGVVVVLVLVLVAGMVFMPRRAAG